MEARTLHGWKPLGLLLVPGLAMLGVVVWDSCRGHVSREETTASLSVATAEPLAEPQPDDSEPAAAPARLKLEEDGALPQQPPVIRMGHTLDPCKRAAAPVIPQGYERHTAAGVTVAWSPEDEGYLQPIVLAHLVAGLLEQAAMLTGTVRRSTLSVIVYPTRKAFRAHTGGTSRASGLYDGAIRLPAVRHERDFGLRLSTLRHEIMHAQLHAGVGCLPIWLHEGAATYLSGWAPDERWVQMLRQRTMLPFDRLAVSSVADTRSRDVELVYAQSLAMVLYLIDQSNAKSLREIISIAERTSDYETRLDLWHIVQPTMSNHELLDWLGQWLFDTESDDVWKEIVSGAVCCRGFYIDKVNCSSTPPKPGEKDWWDTSPGRFGHCTAP